MALRSARLITSRKNSSLNLNREASRHEWKDATTPDVRRRYCPLVSSTDACSRLEICTTVADTSRAPLTRREMLRRCAGGFGAVALAALMGEPGVRRGPCTARPSPLAPRPPHFPARARSVIFLYMDGGPSQVDTFDPKPRLDREHGQPIKVKIEPTQFNNVGNVLEVAVEVPASTARAASRSATCSRTSRSCVDDLAVDPLDGRRSSPSTPAPTTSCTPARACRAGRAWARGSTYGLGSECRDLPGFVVLNGGLIPPGGLDNFNSGFLPASYQGSIFTRRRRTRSPTSAAASRPPSSSAASSTCCASSTAASLDRLGARRRARVGDRQLRAGLPDADGRARADGPRPARSQATQQLYGLDDPYAPTRSSAGSACSPAGWSSAACGSSS